MEFEEEIFCDKQFSMPKDMQLALRIRREH